MRSCGKVVWQSRVAMSCGKVVWQCRVEAAWRRTRSAAAPSPSPPSPLRARLSAACRPHSRTAQHRRVSRVEKSCGKVVWQCRVEKSCGKVVWKSRVDDLIGQDRTGQDVI